LRHSPNYRTYYHIDKNKVKKLLDTIGNAYLKSEKKVKSKAKQIKKNRKNFSKKTKEKILEIQNYRCRICGKKSEFWDFDHIGDRSNNSSSNCQALCLDCHAKKTRTNKSNFL